MLFRPWSRASHSNGVSSHQSEPSSVATSAAAPSSHSCPGFVQRLVHACHHSYHNPAGPRKAAPLPPTPALPLQMASQAPSSPVTQPTHLIICVNGLWGHSGNWNTIVDQLRRKLPTDQVLIWPSQVNRRLATYDGIDVCGWRLADEIQGVVAKHPTLKRISVMGHSMGGLILRFAIGVCFDPDKGTVAGLRPCHFITLATPHLGCDADGVSQVPFIGWLGFAAPLKKLFSLISVPTAGLLLQRTGKQFFLADTDMSHAPGVNGLPLLARMTKDVPERKEYFLSALASFASRTAYANTGRDHLVGWANSSLRFMHQLPTLPASAAKAKGVVLEDDVLAAFDNRLKQDPETQYATGPDDIPITGHGSETAASRGGGSGTQSPRHSSQPGSPRRSGSFTRAPSLPLQDAHVNGNVASHGTGPVLSPAVPAAATSRAAASTLQPSHSASLGDDQEAAMVEGMLQRLQAMPWRRIDVSFAGSVMPLAHNQIQVTRRWLDFEGESVAVHLADQVASMDKLWIALHSRAQDPANVTKASSGSQGCDQRANTDTMSVPSADPASVTLSA